MQRNLLLFVAIAVAIFGTAGYVVFDREIHGYSTAQDGDAGHPAATGGNQRLEGASARATTATTSSALLASDTGQPTDVDDSQDVLKTIITRLSDLQRDIETVSALARDTAFVVDGLLENGPNSLSTEQYANTLPPPPASATRDLSTLLADETRTSEWGDRVSTNLNDAYEQDFSTRPFFLEHGATIASDCRESICRVELRMAELAPGMPDDEKAELVMRAERELLALAGRAGGVGRVSTVVDTTSDTPSIALLMQQQRETTGGDTQSRYRPHPFGPAVKSLQ